MAHLDEPHPFALETATLHYAAERPVIAQHLALRLEVDFEERQLRGTATHRLEAAREVTRIAFDAVELDVSAVRVDGVPARFDADGATVTVHLAKPRARASVLSVELSYSATPRRGFYFIGPDAAEPKRRPQAWTQGQDEDSRYWFPCLDTPAQKCPSEVQATFPSRMTSLSNGTLLTDTVRGARRTMHWRLDQPHAPYLVTLVVGEFEVHEARAGKTTVRTLYPPGRKADALRCVRRTPQMVALFEALTGAPYPWGDYAQVFVSEFIFGGMENTGATTLTDAVLHDARAALDYSAEFLIAHELAHQWFGDLLTCRDWPHGWLNEGFATYAEVLWQEEANGADEADHQRRLDLEAYLAEVSERYARPIVARSFDQPIDLFDRHLYEKGGLVLHELRTRLGDEDFRRAVQHYVAAHRHGSVETVDLARAVSESTGRTVDRFFDEYVYRAGHPQLAVELKYSSSEQQLEVRVKQTQAGEAFALTLPVSVMVAGKHAHHRFEVTEKQHRFTVPLAGAPQQCVIDGRRDLLATLKVDKPIGWWRDELLHAPVARARAEAAVACGKDGAAASLDALRRSLENEREFWATRAASAKALAAVRSPSAKAALIAALKVKHPKVRRAVVSALCVFVEDEQVQHAIERVCRGGDASVFVEAEAARTLGKLRAPKAKGVLATMLKRPSFQDTVRSGAIDGLAATLDVSAWQLIVSATRLGQPPFARRAAINALAKLAEEPRHKREAVEVLTRALRDPSFRVRLAAIDAATTLGDERLVGPLRTTPFLDGRERRAAREAVRALRGKTAPKELHGLRSELDALKNEVASLKEKLAAGVGTKKSKRAR